MEGFLLIDKPANISSHGVVDRVRRVTGVKRVGHAGTLDPFATGLLIVGVGRGATKRLGGFLKSDKVYEATAILGASSDTQDLNGVITPTVDAVMPDEATLRKSIANFLGRQKQVPPMYSAKKIAGQKLYELARQGQVIERQPNDIEIFEMELSAYRPPRVDFRVHCSSGTYVRTLAHDLGDRLGTGAYLEALRRTAIGIYDVREATKLDDLTSENWPEKLVSQS